MRSTRRHRNPKSRNAVAYFTGAAALAAAGCASLGFDADEHSQQLAAADVLDQVVTDDRGMKVAPAPDEEFRNQACSAPEATDSRPEPGQLTIPSRGITTDLREQADLLLPEAPEGILYNGSAPLDASAGKTVTAGHVDYAPGALTDRGGELSPWGHMHEANACDPVYLTAQDGTLHIFVITDKYTVPQEDLEAAGVFETTGDRALVMVTCSGESVPDAGEDFQFRYDHNLVLEAEEVLA